MGKIVVKRKLDLDELFGRTVAIDAYNVIYQFLSIIRQPDGTPLMGPNGEVTSHLSGLFYRTMEIMQKGIKPIYVFDGIPSHLKQRTIMARIGRREQARAQWEQAKIEGDEEAMRIKAQASTRITKEVVASSMELLDCLGVGYIKAPGEGEAQASVMAADGVVYAACSQDYDTLLFGAPRIVRNLTFSGRRKLPRKNVYINVETEIIDLNNTLAHLGITREQLIWLGILIGTDFNEGIDKVGPKTALKISKSAGSIEDVKRYVAEKLNSSFDVDIKEVESLFTNPEVRRIDLEEVKSLTAISCNKQATVEFMCNQHGFSQDRIGKFLDVFESASNKQRQKGIDAWLSG